MLSIREYPHTILIQSMKHDAFVHKYIGYDHNCCDALRWN